MDTKVVKFEDITLNVIENSQYEWILSTEQVAIGYGVADSTIRSHKLRRPNELIENKHFVTVANCNGGEAQTFWTKRGVVRLGFFIRSKHAVKFRDWAEDLVIEEVAEQKSLTPAEALLQNVQLLVEQERKIQEHDHRILKLEAKTTTRPNYFTVAGYATLQKIRVSLSIAAKYGRKASDMCKLKGYPIDKCTDPRWGEVNMYPEDVLSIVFEAPIN